MTKSNMLFWWVLAWQGVSFFTNMTPTKADDAVVNVLRTEQVFEEFWAILVERGWVTNNSFVPGRVQGSGPKLARLTASVTTEGEAKVTAA